MADEAPETAPVEEPTTPAAEIEDEPRIPRERLNQEAKKRKDAEKRASELERRLEALEAQGLSETEQERKARERAERERDELRAERDEIAKQAHRSRAENLISAAAQAAGFEDAEDAVLRINADDVESAEDAERAVKRLAKQKPRLLKAEEPKLPGRVLEGGRTVQPGQPATTRQADEEFAAGMLEQINALRATSQPVGGLFGDQ